ncbi:23S rRNA (cytidine(2498)-2'-O)-methyltransferase RlmM [Coralloluteibacterium thermophilus]|uniref:Ribosomal RNA large subunit methyltransferase M n=1 Tax=Coralloluteibacterium thermophilum TaxID=2707049 RepID=A0ABV9NRL1_9GAMM
MSAVDGLLGYCRAGFEPELAAEYTARAAEAGLGAYAKTERNSGVVQLLGADGAGLAAALPWRDLVFARQSLRLLAELRGLDPRDRLTPLLAALSDRGLCFGDVWVEHPDSEAGRPLSGLARAFGNALRPALRRHGLLAPAEDARLPRLHVCLLAGDHALLAVADPKTTSPWPLGIPRLRIHGDAPSRSAAKLEEAITVLLDPDERARRLQAGMYAADLGAAPGGWSWILARRYLRVWAIDNGPLAESAHATGLIEHVRADGFRWQPPQTLEWMVCDMVEQPRRVADRIATWLREGWCRQTIFNLKLPMKKRWDETVLCLDLLRERTGMPLDIRARQLYHDREEITVYARRSRSE